jgi:hypothetical protein
MVCHQGDRYRTQLQEQPAQQENREGLRMAESCEAGAASARTGTACHHLQRRPWLPIQRDGIANSLPIRGWINRVVLSNRRNSNGDSDGEQGGKQGFPGRFCDGETTTAATERRTSETEYADEPRLESNRGAQVLAAAHLEITPDRQAPACAACSRPGSPPLAAPARLPWIGRERSPPPPRVLGCRQRRELARRRSRNRLPLSSFYLQGNGSMLLG